MHDVFLIVFWRCAVPIVDENITQAELERLSQTCGFVKRTTSSTLALASTTAKRDHAWCYGVLVGIVSAFLNTLTQANWRI
jgi:hypothetical protein